MTYIVELSILIAIWTMLAVSFNLVIGFVGLLVVAHRLFYAFGAYGAGLLMIHTDMPAFVAIAITCMGAGLLSWRKHQVCTVPTTGDPAGDRGSVGAGRRAAAPHWTRRKAERPVYGAVLRTAETHRAGPSFDERRPVPSARRAHGGSRRQEL